MWRSLLLAALLAPACSGRPGGGANKTCAPGALVEQVTALRTDGYLGRALARAEHAVQTCPTGATELALAETLGELGLDARAIAAYERLAARGNAQARARAQQAIAELRKRPPARREGTDEDRNRALALYRAGVNLRLGSPPDYDRAIAKLRKSYAVWPHPLTIVQIGLAHRGAGREVEARKAFARALALAESTRETRAVPKLAAGHGTPAMEIALSPDGKRAGSISILGRIIVWDTLTGRPIRIIDTENPPLARDMTLMAFDQSMELAVTGRDKKLKLWRLATGQLMREIELERAAQRVAFAASGALVVCDSSGHLATISYDDSGVRSTPAGAAGWGIDRMEVSTDGNTVALLMERAVEIWSLSEGKRLQKLTPGTTWDKALALDPAATRVAANDGDHDLAIWNVQTGQRERVLRGHTGLVLSAAWSPDGHRLATGSKDKTIRIWNAETGEQIRAIEGHTDDVAALRWSADGKRILASDDASKVTLWNADDGRKVRTFGERVELPADVAWSANGKRIATASVTGRVTVWDSRGARAERLAASDQRVTFLALSRSGNVLVVQRSGEQPRVWNIANPKQPRALAPALGNGARIPPADSVAYEPSTNSIVVVAKSSLHFLDAETGRFVRTVQLKGGEPDRVTFSPTATRVAFRDRNSINVFDMASGRPVGGVTSDQSVGDVFLSDDDTIVARVGDATVATWNVPSGEKLSAETVPSAVIVGASLSPFSNLIATACSDGAIRTLQLGTWDQHEIGRHSSVAIGVAFGPNDILASTGLDKTLRLWRVSTGEPVATLASTGDGAWVVIAPDGRIDGPPGENGAASLLYWEIGDVQLPGFVGAQRADTPGLLATILR